MNASFPKELGTTGLCEGLLTPHLARPRRRTNHSAFTLIEMLTVIAIISLMIVIGVVSLVGLGKSTALSTGTRQVATTMQLARQLAITMRRPVRVVFPMAMPKNPVAGGTKCCTNLWYQSYAVMTNDPTSAAVNPAYQTNGVWGYYGNWEYLPANIYFADGQTTAGSLDNWNNISQATNALPTNACPTCVQAMGVMAYVEFRSSGAPFVGGGLINHDGGSFYLVQGYFDPTNTTHKVWQTGTANWSLISVDGLLGKIQVTRP